MKALKVQWAMRQGVGHPSNHLSRGDLFGFWLLALTKQLAFPGISEQSIKSSSCWRGWGWRFLMSSVYSTLSFVIAHLRHLFLHFVCDCFSCGIRLRWKFVSSAKINGLLVQRDVHGEQVSEIRRSGLYYTCYKATLTPDQPHSALVDNAVHANLPSHQKYNFSQCTEIETLELLDFMWIGLYNRPLSCLYQMSSEKTWHRRYNVILAIPLKGPTPGKTW